MWGVKAYARLPRQTRDVKVYARFVATNREVCSMPEDVFDELERLRKKRKKKRLLEEEAERDIMPVRGKIEGKK